MIPKYTQSDKPILWIGLQVISSKKVLAHYAATSVSLPAVNEVFVFTEPDGKETEYIVVKREWRTRIIRSDYTMLGVTLLLEEVPF